MRPGTNEPRLVVPEGWVIDEAARERLERQLAGAPSLVAGVVAETGALPAGASYRVHAEWRSLEPLSAAVESTAGAARGAVLVRPGVRFEVRDDVVEVAGGPLLVDPGAHVHDPWAAVGAAQTASERGRPPFPRRPVVVFLALGRDRDLADWARLLVNRLVRRDVEGRLAMHDVAEGMHLTAPCLPNEESIAALGPDVIVTLDSAATEVAPAWCGSDRSVVIVEFVPDLAGKVELVSWRLGQASGRRRARIGRRVDASSLDRLVRRLCAGPHPMPPSGIEVTESDSLGHGVQQWGRRRSTLPSVVVAAAPAAASSARLEGLVDHLSTLGVTATVSALGRRVPAAARSADLLLLSAATPARALDELIDARRRGGRVTVVDLGPGDLVADSGSARLTPGAAHLAGACGLATTSVPAVHASLRGLAARAHLLPTPLTRARAGALRSARDARDASTEVVLGWHVGSVGTPVPAYLGAVADAVLTILADRPDVRVEVTGDPTHVPTELRAHARVAIASGELEAQALGRWAVHLWTPPVLKGEVADDPRPFAEASYVGAPSLLGAESRAAIDGYWAADLVVGRVEQADDWTAPLRSLLDDEKHWAERSRESIRRGHALDGPAASKAVVNRFLGWALYQARR